MALPIVTWTHRAEATDEVVKHVLCEGCGHEFGYFLERTAKGHGTSFFFLNIGSARDEALEKAYDALYKELAKGCDPVACPECGLFQEEMVRSMRRRHLRWMRVAGWIVCITALILGPLNAICSDFDAQFVDWNLFLLLAAVGPALLLMRRAIAWTLDPNEDLKKNRKNSSHRAVSLEELENELKRRERDAERA